MSFAYNIGEELFGITSDKIWGTTNQIKSYLPKFRYLNSAVSTNSYIHYKANILTDISFRPNTYNPNRTWNVYQGLNFPIVNYLVHPGTGPEGYGWHSAVLNSTAELQYPFSVKKGLLKREHLALDAFFAHIKFTFEQKRTNALSIVEKVTNLSTYYADNDDNDYANTIAYHQARADHLTVCIATIDLLRSQIATNVDDINNFAENDFDADVAYTELIAALTYPTELLDYISMYGSSSLNRPSEYLRSLMETFPSNPDNPLSPNFYNPIRTEGRISLRGEVTEFFSTNASYKALGGLYDQEFLDPTLYPKGTTLNEETSSLRKNTNGIILGTTNKLKGLQYYDYLGGRVESYASFAAQTNKYLAQYVHEESLNTYSTTFRFGSRPDTSELYGTNDEYVKGHVDLGLIESVSFYPGTTDPTPDQELKSLPKVISSAFNYKVAPKILLRTRQFNAHENNTVLVGVAMLLRKTLEVDFILNRYYPTDDLPDSSLETSDFQYNLFVNHLSPKETVSYIEDANDDYPFYKIRNGPAKGIAYSSVGDRSTLIGDNKTINYGTSNNVNHLDIPERNLKQIVNVIDQYGNLSLSHTSLIDSNSDNNTKNNGEAFYVHSHGREHPSLGLYDLEDLFVSASHLGDRYDKKVWAEYDLPLRDNIIEETDSPQVVYRRGYDVENLISNLLVGVGPGSSLPPLRSDIPFSTGYYLSERPNYEFYWEIDNVYATTQDGTMIWHGKSVDSPSPKPWLWLYKCKMTYKFSGVDGAYFEDGTPDLSYNRYEFYYEGIRNGYFLHRGYNIGPHYPNSVPEQVPLYLFNPANPEWLYYRDYSILTSSSGTTTYEDSTQTFSETPIQDVIDFALVNNQWTSDLAGSGWIHVPTHGSGHDVANDVYSIYPWDDLPNANIKSSQVQKQFTLPASPSFYPSKDYPIFNINFSVEPPL